MENYRSLISKTTGLTGVEAGHILSKLEEQDIDPQSIDWVGAISDMHDVGDRYEAVKNYLFDYYGVNIMTRSVDRYPTSHFAEQSLEDVTSSKKGVKEALRLYYNSGSKQEKEMIKDVLLHDIQANFVLMTALYDGEEMPLAKRFLKEAMGEQTTVLEPTETISERPVETPVVTQPSVYDETKYVFETNRAGNDNNKKHRSLKDMIPRIEKDIDYNIKIVSRQLKQSISPKYTKSKKMVGLKSQIQQLKAQNEPLRLQLEYQRLLHQRQQLLQLKKMQNRAAGPNPANIMLANLIGFPMPQSQPLPIIKPVLSKPGYYIEYQPKLPTGYRWKKLPKNKKNKKRGR